MTTLQNISQIQERS